MANWKQINNGTLVVLEKQTDSFIINVSVTDVNNMYRLDIILKSNLKIVYTNNLSVNSGGIKALKNMANNIIQEYAKINMKRLNELLN